MPQIKRSCIEDIRLRVNIHDVVSPYVALKKSGGAWKGLSPFTAEKTPSFFVYPEKGFCWCFSTNQGGDIFKFIQAKENLSFPEAVEMVAHRFNIPLEYDDDGRPPEAISLRKELFGIHDDATTFFNDALFADTPDAAATRDYWTHVRRFPLQAAKDFKIGFAPVNGAALLDLMVRKRYSLDALRQCGLFFAYDNERDPRRFRCRFRGRLMIPIRDIQGRVIAFTARQLPLTPQDDPARDAKYVNSPETPIFKKSDVLFGLDRAHAPVKDTGGFVLVEGQLDTLRCWLVGLNTAVAPQGTAITENQLHLLRRYAGKIECLLDGDAAGQKAALRLLPMALKAGLEITFLPLPADSDPDELFLEKGAAALDELRAGKLDAMAFAARSLAPNGPDALSPREKASALEQVFMIVSQCDSEVMRDDYLTDACRRLRIERTSAERDFRKYLAAQAARTNTQPPRADTPAPAHSPLSAKRAQRLTTAEFELLVLLFHHDDLAQSLAQIIQPEWINDETVHQRVLRSVVLAIQHEGWHPGIEGLDTLLATEEERTCVYGVLAHQATFEDPLREANRCLAALYSRAIEREKRRIENLLANDTDFNRRQEHLRERRRLMEAMKTPPQLFPTT